MAWSVAEFRLTSDSPLLMKNGQTADPRNKFAKASKEITGKRKKTDADHEELQHIDFLGALYMGKDGPCIPGRLIEAAIINGAKKEKSGPQAKCGVYCDENFTLEYDGPRDPEELFNDDNFRDTQVVRIGAAKTMRCRPIFRDWAATVRVHFDDELVNAGQLERWFQTAGQQVGVGDFRPRYGRFSAELLGELATT